MKWLKIIESKWFSLFFFLFSFVILFSISDHYFGWTNKRNKESHMAHSDGACYYGYMPQWFIYHTKNFEFRDSIALKYPEEGFEDHLDKTNNGGYTNKYFCGTSILSSPFFLIGHAHAKLYNNPQDGYSRPYLMWVNIGSIFYAILGLYAIFLIGIRLGFRKWKIYLTLIAIMYGTTLFFYTTIEIPYSHVFCFSSNAWVLFALLEWKEKNSISWKIAFFIILGLAIIIRPTNILVLSFTPFLWDSWSLFWKWFVTQFKVYWKSTTIGIFLLVLVILLQFYNVKLQFGYFKFNSYVNEGFYNWKSPYIISTLFGFNKGMFIYSPVLILIIPGIYFMYKWNKYRFVGFLLSFVIIVYIISSWWCWTYGGSFGLRAYVDFYSLFSIPILVLFEKINKWGLLLLFPVLGMAIFLHQTFDTQYKLNIIHYDNMSYEKLKLVFLKTDPRYRWLTTRNFDTLSPAFKPIGEKNNFIDPKHRKEVGYFNFLNTYDNDGPYITIKFPDKIKYENRAFAYSFRGRVKIKNYETYLSLITTGYKDGKVLFNFDNPYGYLPAKKETWCDVSCNFVSNWRIKEIDSVNIKFFYTASPAEIKIKSLVWGTDINMNKN